MDRALPALQSTAHKKSEEIRPVNHVKASNGRAAGRVSLDVFLVDVFSVDVAVALCVGAFLCCCSDSV